MVDFIIPMYIPVLLEYSSYIQAVKRHLKNEENFEEFLLKETAERKKYYGGTNISSTIEKIFFPFITLIETKMYDDRRAKFINQFFQLRPHILNEKILQVLTNHKTNVEAISVGSPLQKFIDGFESAEKKAVEELEKKTRLAPGSRLWMQAKEELVTQIDTFKKNFYENQPLFVYENERAAINDSRGITQAHLDASKIKVDMNNTGFLGKGGFGEVRVGNIEYWGTVAVKIPRRRGSVQVDQKNFSQEINLMLQANHKHIVQIIGYTSWNNSMAMIMEYMPGVNLSSLLLNKIGTQFLVPVIPDALCRRFCFDISSGVTYLHYAFYDERIVHGDLKPNNILLTGELRCKIGDFGGADIATCSECLNDSIAPPCQKKKGQWTPGFIAPERLNNQELRVGKAMDVYSIGMIFYVILRRQPPWEDVLRNNEEIARFCQQPSQENLKRLTLQCTDHDHLKRPNMQTVRDELQSLLYKEDSAEIVQSVAEVLKSYKCKSFIGSTSSWLSLANVDNF